jgi:hypothetical protein
MTVTRIDRIKNIVMTALVNWRHPVTREEHARQRARVQSAELRQPARDTHQTYLIRRDTGGYTNGPVIRHTPGGWKSGQQTPPRPGNRSL